MSTDVIRDGRGGLTARSFVIGTILALAWTLYDIVAVSSMQLFNVQIAILAGFGLLLTVGTVRLLDSLLPERVRLSPREMTVIFVMTGVAIPWGLLCRVSLESIFQMLIVHNASDDPTRGWIPAWWAVKSELALNQLRQGGVGIGRIRWSDWMWPMLFWGGLIVSFEAFAVSVALLLKPALVDEEKLPFPLATMAETVIQPAQAGKEERWFRWLLVGAFVAGVLLPMRSILSVSPDATLPMMPNAEYYGTMVNAGYGVSLRLNWDPVMLLFVLFFPLDVLLTAVVTYVGLFVGVPLLSAWMGLPIPRVSMYATQVIGVGGFLGLAIWTVVFDARSVVRYVRGRLASAREGGADQATRGWVALVFALASGTAFVTLMVKGIPWEEYSRYLTGSVACTALAVFIILVRLVSVLRMRGEMSWAYHSPWSTIKCLTYSEKHYFTGPWFGMAGQESMYRTQSGYLHAGYVSQFGAYFNTFAPHIHLMEAFKLGSRNGTRARDILKAALWTFLLVLVVVFPAYVVMVHHFGYDNSRPENDYSNAFTHTQPTHVIGYGEAPAFWRQTPPWIYLPLGIVIVGVLMYLKREYVGFPFSPVGYVMAVCVSYDNGTWSTGNIWLPLLAAYIIKRVVFKWFGVGWFQRRMAPVVMRVMLGIVAGMVIFLMLFYLMGRGTMKAG